MPRADNSKKEVKMSILDIVEIVFIAIVAIIGLGGILYVVTNEKKE